MTADRACPQRARFGCVAVDETWETVELPILESTRQAEVDGEDQFNNDDLATATGFERPLIDRTLLALTEAFPPYITGVSAASEELCYLLGIRLLERGRRAVRQWPNEDAAEQFLELVEKRANETEDPEERSRLRQLLSTAGSISRETLAEVIAAVVTNAAGIG